MQRASPVRPLSRTTRDSETPGKQTKIAQEEGAHRMDTKVVAKPKFSFLVCFLCVDFSEETLDKASGHRHDE